MEVNNKILLNEHLGLPQFILIIEPRMISTYEHIVRSLSNLRLFGIVLAQTLLTFVTSTPSQHNIGGTLNPNTCLYGVCSYIHTQSHTTQM